MRSPDIVDGLGYPTGITPKTENIVRRKLFTGHLWWRHQRDFPEVVLEFMSQELKERGNAISRLPSGEISMYFYGYVALIAGMEMALRYRDPKYRLI